MKKLAVAVVVFAMCSLAGAELIWQENFSDVNDWTVAWQNGDAGASISSDGTYGLMYVNSAFDPPAAAAAFSPSAFMAFNETTWDNYTLSYDVESVTWSMSYTVGFDEYDGPAVEDYIGSVSVYLNGTATGIASFSLDSVTWNPATTHVRPKVSMSVGDGGQTLTIDNMQLDSAVIPEPTTAMLVGLGLLGSLVLRKRARR